MWMKLLDNPEQLKTDFEVLGASHAKRNIENEQYARMRFSFIKSMHKRIGPRHCNEADQKVIDKLLGLAMSDILHASDRERTKRGVVLF